MGGHCDDDDDDRKGWCDAHRGTEIGQNSTRIDLQLSLVP